VTTSPTYSHSSSMSPPRVTYHKCWRPSDVVASMRVVLRGILKKCSGMEDLGFGLGFDLYAMFL
jgi:hypothetical protein